MGTVAPVTFSTELRHSTQRSLETFTAGKSSCRWWKMKIMLGSVPPEGVSLFLAQACGKFHQVLPFPSLLSSYVTKDINSLSLST